MFLSRRLTELPATFDALERGRLTWEQVRLVARVATPDDDRHWSEAASRMYPAELYREMARRTQPKLRDERAAHASRYLRLVWDADHPVLYVEGCLGKEQGSRLEEAIRDCSRGIPPDPGADDPSEARRADALVELCTSGGSVTQNAPKPQMVVHASLEVLTRTAPKAGPWLAETESSHRLHPETVRRIGCDADVELLLERDGRPFGIGRKSPRIPGWLERAVRHRDGGTCRFPGCERRISLLSHHIKHWADGGPTDLENLVTLCSSHHRYVHEDGWRHGRHPDHELRFHDPTGRARASPEAA